MLPLPTPGPFSLTIALDARGRAVVRKRLRPEHASREDLALRLANEGAVLARVGGTAHVIALLDDEAGPPRTLVLEWCDGGSLAEMLARGPVDRAMALRWGGELCAALAHLHAHGVLHRDVTPANILLKDGAVRLADFGVAASGTPPRALPAGWVEDAVGTPGWRAPELDRDPSAATPASDVHGAARVIAALLGDTPAWLREALAEEPGGRPSAAELGARVRMAQRPGPPS